MDTWPDISRTIWETKYRFCRGDDAVDGTPEDTWRRVARAAAAGESDASGWEARFYDVLREFRFLPGGRIIANAGTGRTSTTLFNCYVMGAIEDSIEGIFDVVKESALTQKQGGGVGYDFSTIRPRGSRIMGVDSPASGPLSFMHVLDATCRTIMSAGQRRGAQMGILRCDHPDIESFIEAKRENGALRMFNLSVAVTDAFMEAVESDSNWDLVFNGEVYRTVRARELWDRIMRSTYEHAEPGIFMVDRVNAMNNLAYRETIRATNPCGEQPLPPYGACLLGSLNLTRFVLDPFGDEARIDFDDLASCARVAVRLLDNMIELSNYPLDRQREQALSTRRMGIGITGLADALIFLGFRYGSRQAIRVSERIMRTITHSAYESSIELAGERGCFPAFDAEAYVSGGFVSSLPKRLRTRIASAGIRNSHLTSIAPTGTISLLAGNISSGMEPVFATHYTRRIRSGDGDETVDHEVLDYAYAAYCRRFERPASDEELPPAFVTTDHVTPAEHIAMQAALQKHVDSSISKTINVPGDYPFEDFKDVYRMAYKAGLKGCTTFRPSAQLSGVLVRESEAGESAFGKRPQELQGTTYKVKTPLSPDAFYITINDVEDGDAVRPYEIFINTKNLQHFSWIVAMTRLISAVFRKERDPSFLVEELKSIYDPAGGYYSDGEYVPSLPAELGRVLEAHLSRLGFLPRAAGPGRATAASGDGSGGGGGLGGICPICRQPGLYSEENCLKCRYCDYSKCG